MKKLRQLFVWLLVAGALSGCAKIDELNDYNTVFGFNITDYQGTGGNITIDDAVVNDHEVVIPVKYGIHNFPLRFKGEPRFANPIDRVAGIDFSDWVTIDLKRGGEDGKTPILDDDGNYLFEEPRFFVQAISGLPREYTFRVQYGNVSNDANIYPDMSFSGTPDGSIVSGIVSVEPGERAGGTVTIYVANVTYPFTIIPTFSIGDGASLEGNGTKQYEFKDSAATNTVTVEAKDGTLATWIVGLGEVPTVNVNSADVSEADLLDTNLEDVAVEARSKGFSVEEISFGASEPEAPGPDPQPRKVALDASPAPVADTLVVYVATYSTDPFPMTISVKPNAANSVAVAGLADELVFTGWDDYKPFFLIDTQKHIARRWVVKLESYKSAMASVLSFSYDYEAETVKDKATWGASVPAIIMDDERSAEIDPVSRKIYLKAVKINDQKATVGMFNPDWSVTLKDISIEVSEGATLQGFGNIKWVSNGSWATPKTFGVKSARGDVATWSIVIRDFQDDGPTPSDECTMLVAPTIREVRPFVVGVDGSEPVVFDAENKSVKIKLTKDEHGYPMSVMLDYTISDYASVTSQNGGRDPLVFTSPETVNEINIVSESGSETEKWTVSLMAPPKEVGAEVLSFQVTSFSLPQFAAEVGKIDSEKGVVNVKFIKQGKFPVTMNFRMGLSYRATSDITNNSGVGSVTFNNYEDLPFTVTAQNGDKKSWVLRPQYEPQLENFNFESWQDDYTPLPKGVMGSPYWSSANMSVGGLVEVKGTTKTIGAPGQGNAVQLKTGETYGNLASGSLFLGWFDSSNPTGNMKDPTIMTFQGIPFSASKKLLGMTLDVSYHPGNGAGSDTGVVTIELIKQRDTSVGLVYHGERKPGEWHPKNNADMVARGRKKLGTAAGDSVFVVADGVWTNIYVPLEYEGAYPQYTHLNVICASSSEGDSFVGEVGSTLKVDNIRLVYEE